MLIEIIKILFSISAIIFSVLIIMHKSFTSKVKDNVKISNFVATIAFSLFVYIICAFILALLSGGLIFKAGLFVCALLPFIIGKFATYQKVKLYSFFQILAMLISTVFIYLK